MRVTREADHLGRIAARLDLVQFADQHFRIDNAAVADHRDLAGDDSGRNLPDLEGLVGDLDRVARIRATLVAAN